MQNGGEVREPENSTVDDWMGQNIQRDTELAEELVEETGDAEEAEQRFEEEADGQETHEEGYPRPDDEQPRGGDGPVGQPS
ncbi:MAG TPA: hypothetical protein VFU19_08965 [Iamia sp.]|nr:hypothetical protein [Iamia sp.]